MVGDASSDITEDQLEAIVAAVKEHNRLYQVAYGKKMLAESSGSIRSVRNATTSFRNQRPRPARRLPLRTRHTTAMSVTSPSVTTLRLLHTRVHLATLQRRLARTGWIGAGNPATLTSNTHRTSSLTRSPRCTRETRSWWVGVAVDPHIGLSPFTLPRQRSVVSYHFGWNHSTLV